LYFANVHAEKSGVYELLKRGIVEKAFGEMRLAKEFSLLEEFKKHLSKEDGLACYGLKDVEKALEYGAVESILVLDELVRTNPQVAALFEQARKKGSGVTVFDAEGEAGKELKAFGLAALLRFVIRE
jgi:protein pelota